MNLEQALTSLAAQANLDASELIAYAAEDEIGGFDFDESQRKWNVGSLWEVEGKVLYALVRALKPDEVAEFGTHEGCSATHILSALAANGSGELTSVDPWEGAGSKVSSELRESWTMVFHTGIEWLDMQPDASFDLLFEDMGHGVVGTRDWWRVALDKIRPGGVILSHDAAHYNVGKDVMQGIADAGVQATVYAIEPADCGLAVYVAPGAAVRPVPEFGVSYRLEVEPAVVYADTWTAEFIMPLGSAPIEVEAEPDYGDRTEDTPIYPVAETFEDTPAETEAYDEWVDEGMQDDLSYVSSPTPQETDDLDDIVHEHVDVEEDELPPAPKKRKRKGSK